MVFALLLMWEPLYCLSDWKSYSGRRLSARGCHIITQHITHNTSTSIQQHSNNSHPSSIVIFVTCFHSHRLSWWRSMLTQKTIYHWLIFRKMWWQNVPLEVAWLSTNPRSLLYFWLQYDMITVFNDDAMTLWVWAKRTTTLLHWGHSRNGSDYWTSSFCLEHRDT